MSTIAVCNEYIVIARYKDVYVHNQINGENKTFTTTDFAWSVFITDQYIILGLQDNTVRVYNMNGDLKWELNGHTGSVYCVCASDQFIVSGSLDTTLRIWSIENGECVRTLTNHTSAAFSVCESDRFIISGPSDGIIKIWDVNGNTHTHTLTGHTDFVYSVCTTTNGQYIVSGSRDHTLRIWDTNSGECIHTFIGHTDSVYSVCVSGDYIISSSKDGTIRVWSMIEYHCCYVLQNPALESIWCVRTTSDGQYIIAHSTSHKIYVWHILMGTLWRCHINSDVISLPNCDSRIMLYSLMNI